MTFAPRLFQVEFVRIRLIRRRSSSIGVLIIAGTRAARANVLRRTRVRKTFSKREFLPAVCGLVGFRTRMFSTIFHSVQLFPYH